jgi:hypothetical protein
LDAFLWERGCRGGEWILGLAELAEKHKIAFLLQGLLLFDHQAATQQHQCRKASNRYQPPGIAR